MNTPLYGASAVLIALTTATYLACAPQPQRHEPFYTARRARLFVFTAGFASAFLLIPPAALAVDEFTGRDGTSSLLFALTTALTLLSLQIVALNWTHPPDRLRRAVTGRICFVGCVMALLIWEFHRTHASSAELTSTSPASSEAALYMLTHLGFLDVMILTVCLRYATLARAAWPRRRIAAAGLAVTALGILCGVVYAVARTGAAVAHLAGQAWPPTVETHVIPITGALAAFFVTLGLTLPTITHRIVLPLHRARTGRVLKDSAVRRTARP